MSDIKHDPQEDNPKTKEIIDKAREEAILKVKEKPEFVETPEELILHVIWKEQKQILKEKYDIDWKTPMEMNPDVIFN